MRGFDGDDGDNGGQGDKGDKGDKGGRETRALVTRFLVRSAGGGAGPDNVVEGKSGVLSVGVPSQRGVPGLVLLVDERGNNPGASATNAAAILLPLLRERWAGEMAVAEANIVECDSEGNYDHAVARWGVAGAGGGAGGRSRGALGTYDSAASIEWAPLRWAGAPPRTKHAFKGLFGEHASAALAAAAAYGVAT